MTKHAACSGEGQWRLPLCQCHTHTLVSRSLVRPITRSSTLQRVAAASAGSRLPVAAPAAAAPLASPAAAPFAAGALESIAAAPLSAAGVAFVAVPTSGVTPCAGEAPPLVASGFAGVGVPKGSGS